MVPRVELVVPSAADVERLFSLSTPLAPLWTLLVGSGLRLGEALGVRWLDVDLLARSLIVRVSLRPIPRAFRPEAIKGTWTHQRLKLVEPKTASSRRTIALPSFVVRALLAHRARQTQMPANILGLVFTTPRGTPLDQRNVSRAFAADCSKAALPHLRLHDLRHVAASLMLAQGASLDDVKRVLGHSSIALTSDTYGHLVEGRSRDVADRLDRLFG
jgi:integrase